MHIGLFGGAFNPPHVGHLIVAESARIYAGLDHVLWIPTGHPPHKSDTPFAPVPDRLEMVALAIKDNPFFEVSDVESSRPGVSYMIETVALLNERYPNDQLSLIIGGDSLRAFHTWFRYRELVREANLVVFDRPGPRYGDVDPQVLEAVTWVPNAPLLEISSSDIRRRCAENKSIRYLVPEPVEQYIRRRNLYTASAEDND